MKSDSATLRAFASQGKIDEFRIYAEFAQSLIAIASPLYAGEPLGVDLKETVSVPHQNLISIG